VYCKQGVGISMVLILMELWETMELYMKNNYKFVRGPSKHHRTTLVHRLPKNSIKIAYYSSVVVLLSLLVVYLYLNILIGITCQEQYKHVDMKEVKLMSKVFAFTFLGIIVVMTVLSVFLLDNLRVCFHSQFKAERRVLMFMLTMFVIGFVSRAVCDYMLVKLNSFIDHRRTGVSLELFLFFFWDLPILIMYLFHIRNFREKKTDPKATRKSPNNTSHQRDS